MATLKIEITDELLAELQDALGVPDASGVARDGLEYMQGRLAQHRARLAMQAAEATAHAQVAEAFAPLIAPYLPQETPVETPAETPAETPDIVLSSEG